MMKSKKTLGVLVAAILLFAVASEPARAEMVNKEQAKALCKAGSVGPVTPYGELPGEAAAKKVVFQLMCMAMVEGKAKEAYEKYVSKDFCNHSHLLTRGVKTCAGYEESLANMERMSKQFSQGDELEIPTMASVNGEMVTMYGAGVDISRVVNGKVTDHWDASPPAEAHIKAHSAESTERMVKVIKDAVDNGTAVNK